MVFGNLAARRRLLRAQKMCRVEEIRALRQELRIEGPPIPSGASSAAVSIGWTRRRFLSIALPCVVGLPLLSLVSAGSEITVGQFVASLALGFLVGVIIPAPWWSRICFDGPSLWTEEADGVWSKPTDLRAVCAYTETQNPSQRRLFAKLLSVDSAGTVAGVDELNFDAETTERLNRMGPFAVHTIEIGRHAHAAGLGEYLLRYIDPATCDFGGKGLVWHRMRRAQDRDTIDAGYRAPR